MAEQAQRAKALARTLGIESKHVKIKTQLTRVEVDDFFKEGQRRFQRNSAKGARSLLFVYCGGYGVVDKEHHFILNDDYRFVYAMESFLKSLSKFATIVAFYDFVR